MSAMASRVFRRIPPPHKLVRREGPVSSRDAAVAAVESGLVLSHEAMILRVLAARAGGLTGKEVAEAIGRRFGVRRVRMMIEAGLIHRPLADGDDEGSFVRRGRETVLRFGRGPERVDLPLWQGMREPQMNADGRGWERAGATNEHEGHERGGRVKPKWTHRYVWGNNAVRAAVKGQRCRVLATGAMGTVDVVTEDGTRLLTSRRALRRLGEPERGSQPRAAVPHEERC